MTQFLVLPLNDPTEIKAAIEQNIAPADRFEIQSKQVWLVDFPGKASELSEKLGTKNGSQGSLLITSMTDITGYGPTDMISWITDHDHK